MAVPALTLVVLVVVRLYTSLGGRLVCAGESLHFNTPELRAFGSRGHAHVQGPFMPCVLLMK